MEIAATGDSCNAAILPRSLRSEPANCAGSLVGMTVGGLRDAEHFVGRSGKMFVIGLKV